MVVSRVAANLAMWIAVLVVLWGVAVAWPRDMVRVHSSLTDKAYLVKNVQGAQAAADRLAFLELRIRQFLRKAAEYAPGDPRVQNILQRWDGTLAETPVDTDVAYSIGKGAISLCLRDQEGGLESENSSMFVLIHELAHLATDSYGHRPEFWANMKFLLELAEVTGAYTYQDFDATQVSYCGRRLAASPLSCVKNKTCKSALQ